jgi:hypothetical protein
MQLSLKTGLNGTGSGIYPLKTCPFHMKTSERVSGILPRLFTRLSKTKKFFLPEPPQEPEKPLQPYFHPLNLLA